jgi:hypothetical protein
MSDPSALSSKLRKQRSRKNPGIRLLNIKPHGIMPHDARLLNVSSLSSNLHLPVIVANPRPTNPSPLKGRRRWKMINTIESHLFRCKA